MIEEPEQTNAELAVLSRQDADALLRSGETLAAGASRVSRAFRVDGYDALMVFVSTDRETRIAVEQASDPDAPDSDWRETARYDTEPDTPVNGEFLCVRYAPCAEFARFRETNVSASDQVRYAATVLGLPVSGCCGGDGGGGSGSPGGPGNDIATKPDIAVPVGVETPILTAADIPPGTRRVTIKNEGPDVLVVKGAGDGGGAGRGIALEDDQSMTIGGRDGSVAPLDGFTAGPTGSVVGFLFERD